ncbi:MAG: 4-hydroxythreonine-4-phosphate dehydrogenase PdxA [Candidatus Cloacimonetes bacterium]|nr:4-hydroxythreonine-4-phosphate dehydrogenase PdxA [Candidatus Cloacimonadota bacterium]
MKKIGITIGDPTGIGPEITLKVINSYSVTNTIIVYGSFPIGSKINNLIKISDINEIHNFIKGNLFWIPTFQDYEFNPGKPSKLSGLSAYNAIKKAGKDALKKNIDAIVTGPLSKHSIQLTYPEFIGHTEFFAKQSLRENFVMSFFSEKINVALLTTHLALKDVSKNLNKNKIINQIRLINNSLKKFFHIKKPKLAILGLNPHSGEEGIFGDEEQKIFIPVIKQLNEESVFIDGPFPADTFFSGNYQKYDMIISAYHDQGLIPFKMLSFDKGVNVTLGLPYIRTSVDHGTAFDIAGKNIASEKSMLAALNLAEKMI